MSLECKSMVCYWVRKLFYPLISENSHWKFTLRSLWIIRILISQSLQSKKDLEDRFISLVHLQNNSGSTSTEISLKMFSILANAKILENNYVATHVCLHFQLSLKFQGKVTCKMNSSFRHLQKRSLN